ncbi:uncharacterized protein LOC131845588 [Achroia grisella]|uniref:uncharacterized protein LOC131845588 n=1 Tax=Achroia grisella TaxID=688607 RepID=UPI0027D2E6AB|nr:uncharacterized protein LOC131845588 [Achroia grisella]
MMEINSFCNKYNICVICLSTDRKLRPAVDTKIITNISKIKFSDTCNVCWECNANVRSIVSFRNKVLKAQSIIKSLFKTRMGETLIPSLSQLQQRNIENVGIKPLDAAVPDFISTFHQSNLTLPGIEERTESCIAEEVSSHGVEINGIDIPDDDEIYVVYVDNEGENKNSNENEHRNIYRVRIMGEEEMINDRESRRKSSRFIKCTLKCGNCVEIYSIRSASITI